MYISNTWILWFDQMGLLLANNMHPMAPCVRKSTCIKLWASLICKWSYYNIIRQGVHWSWSCWIFVDFGFLINWTHNLPINYSWPMSFKSYLLGFPFHVSWATSTTQPILISFVLIVIIISEFICFFFFLLVLLVRIRHKA